MGMPWAEPWAPAPIAHVPCSAHICVLARRRAALYLGEEAHGNEPTGAPPAHVGRSCFMDMSPGLDARPAWSSENSRSSCRYFPLYSPPSLLGPSPGPQLTPTQLTGRSELHGCARSPLALRRSGFNTSALGHDVRARSPATCGYLRVEPASTTADFH